jgi:hypothetical protein
VSERAGISLLDHPPPSWAELRLLAIAPGGQRAYDQFEWTGALVVVEHGEVELESLDGCRWPFKRGDVLCLTSVPLRAVHNPGPNVAVLSALARRGLPPSPTCNKTMKGSSEDDHLS